jgi:hypothetical protein
VAARRVGEQWMRELPADAALVEAAMDKILLWTDAVAGSAGDVYPFEVHHPAEKRVIRAEFLASEEACAALLREGRAPAVYSGHYKVFSDGVQQGPFALEELAQRVVRGAMSRSTRVWNMQWNPRSDKWRTAGDELPGLFEHAVGAGADNIPDPD